MKPTMANYAEFADAHRMSFHTHVLPQVGHGQLLIANQAATWCGSELDVRDSEDFWAAYRRGEQPRPPAGHESFGTVIEVGSGVELEEGVNVVPWYEFEFAKGNLWPNAFSDYVVMEARHCSRVRADNPYAVLGEPIGCAVGTVNKVKPQVGDHVVVWGTGFMAKVIVQLLAMNEGLLSLTVIGRNQSALDHIARLAPRANVINYNKVDPLEAVREITRGRLADIVIEVTGAEKGMLDAAQLVRQGNARGQGGIFAWSGFSRFGTRPLNLGHVEGNGMDVVVCHFRAEHLAVPAIARGIELVESGKLDLSSYVNPTFDFFTELDEAGERAANRDGAFGRSIVVMDRVA